MRLLTAVVVVLVLSILLWGEATKTISYQGKITDISGVGVNATLPMVFYFYDHPTVGTLLETCPAGAVDIQKGLFSVDIDLTLSSDEALGNLWIEIEVDGVSLSPRQKVNAEMLAFGAVYADTANFAIETDSARVSGIAHFADTSGFTVNSDTANYATFADSTRIAAFADSARISAFADSAGAVTWDMISNYFMTINDTAFHQIVVSDTFKYLTFVTDTLLSFYKINSDGQTGVYIEQFGHPSLPLFFAIYDSATTRGIVYAAGDTIAIIDPVQTDDGYALLFNSDTALTMNVINDSLGIGVSVDSDTVFYLDYDSLMVDLFGTDDIWGALSDTFDNYSDSLMSEMSDSMDAFRSELSDTLSSRFIGGAGTIPSGTPSVVINEPNVTSTSIIMVTLDCTSGTNAGFNVPVAILNITDGVSFTVGTADGSNVPADLSFEYIIFKP